MHCMYALLCYAFLAQMVKTITMFLSNACGKKSHIIKAKLDIYVCFSEISISKDYTHLLDAGNRKENELGTMTDASRNITTPCI